MRTGQEDIGQSVGIVVTDRHATAGHRIGNLALVHRRRVPLMDELQSGCFRGNPLERSRAAAGGGGGQAVAIRVLVRRRSKDAFGADAATGTAAWPEAIRSK